MSGYSLLFAKIQFQQILQDSAYHLGVRMTIFINSFLIFIAFFVVLFCFFSGQK